MEPVITVSILTVNYSSHANLNSYKTEQGRLKVALVINLILELSRG